MRDAMIAWGMGDAMAAVRARVALAIAVIAAALGACTYEDPSSTDTHFRCDEMHPCPEGVCSAGYCRPFGPGGPGVKCDGGTTCPVGMKCCDTLVGAATCLDLADTCAGISSSCDGVEDCPDLCCADQDNNGACGPASCDTVLCQDNDDCPAGSPMCCFSVGGFDLPWGRCLLACI